MTRLPQALYKDTILHLPMISKWAGEYRRNDACALIEREDDLISGWMQVRKINENVTTSVRLVSAWA